MVTMSALLLLPLLLAPFAAASPPVNFGIVLFRAFDLADVFAPLDALQLLAHNRTLNLHLLAETAEPVVTEPAARSMNAFNSSFWPRLPPTHTFAQALDLPLDVLYVPGGAGTRDPSLAGGALDRFLAAKGPEVDYLLTVCTGAGLAARAGLLDGKRATTNKAAWQSVLAMGGSGVQWVAPARWVVDGKTWSSSGVMAGLDMMMAFIKQVYGAAPAETIARMMEYDVHEDPCWDPFTPLYNISTPYHCNSTRT